MSNWRWMEWAVVGRLVTGIALVSIGFPLVHAADRGFAARAKTAGLVDYDPSTFHALVIGINEYAHWPDLRCAARDARAVGSVLRDLYGFGDVALLQNDQATRAGILTQLDAYLDLDDRQSLLIYFAGHGWMDKRAQTGYWVPVNAQRDAKFDYLANSTVFGDYLSKYRVKHLLVISDSCFSGTMLRGGDSERPSNWKPPAGFRKPSRWVLTSGDLAPVSDGDGVGHSPFATRLLQFFRFGDDRVFGVKDLATYITRNLPGTEPICEPLRVSRHMPGGEFVFCRMDARAEPEPALEMPAAPVVETGKLRVTVAVPASVLISNLIPITYTIQNCGDGVARNTRIRSELPARLKVPGGGVLSFDGGELDPGQAREFRVVAKPGRMGKYQIPVTGRAAGGLHAEASAEVSVQAPILRIAMEAPKATCLGRRMTCRITVENVGDAPAVDGVVTCTLPVGVTYVSASHGGIHKPCARGPRGLLEWRKKDSRETPASVKWGLETLAPGQSRDLTLTTKASALGIVRHSARAEAPSVDVAVTASTTIMGIPAVLLEVIDIEDPIEVGATETYVITATNQGTAADTNVRIRCELEPNETYVSSSGATAAHASGNVITFAPLPSLAAKAKAEWRVVVKAVKPGDVRFKATLTSDRLSRPIEETEATNIY
ncbi:MAG: DUF11 domain-containing protein [Lentisphaerae bacterium]|jgi:uncharacterized repeat protein (TIGR01451 family)|nr:DUF11 domain-containing protein [Lentisphaerota bacterium]